MVDLRYLIKRCLVTHGNKRYNTKEIKYTLTTKVEERFLLDAPSACLHVEPPSFEWISKDIIQKK